MEGTVIRRLVSGDGKIAAEIASAFMDSNKTPKNFFDGVLEDNRNILIAAIRQVQPIGFLIAYVVPALSGANIVYLYEIGVAPDYRRHGIGTAMVKLLKGISVKQGIDHIWVGSSLDNIPACSLWEATGADRITDQYVEFIYHLQPA